MVAGMTTTRALALLCRLAAVELEQAYGAQNIRRTLRDLGWTDEAITAAVERVKGVLHAK